jgi:excisionase family DNA binding protein
MTAATTTGNAGDLLTPQQLADLCQVPVTTVYAWNYKASGPGYLKVGRHVRYLRSEVDRWLAEQAAGTRRTA